jgi:hypothetical protein
MWSKKCTARRLRVRIPFAACRCICTVAVLYCLLRQTDPSHITTDSQSVSQPWSQASWGSHDHILICSRTIFDFNSLWQDGGLSVSRWLSYPCPQYLFTITTIYQIWAYIINNSSCQSKLCKAYSNVCYNDSFWRLNGCKPDHRQM